MNHCAGCSLAFLVRGRFRREARKDAGEPGSGGKADHKEERMPRVENEEKSRIGARK